MKTIVLDGVLMPKREEAYAYLTQQLELPDFCGKNLDALYDALTAETAVPTRLVVCRRELLEQWSYGASLLETMTDAARENPNLQVIFDSGADTAFYI